MSVLVQDAGRVRHSRPALGWSLLALLGGVAVAVPEPLLLIAGVVGLGVTVVAFIQPIVAVPLLLVAVPFGSLARGSNTTDPTTTELSVGGAEIVMAVLTVAWLARGIRRQNIRLRSGAMIVAIVGLVLAAGVSIGYAIDKSAAIKETLKWFELLLALLIVVDLVPAAKQARWVIGAMLVAGAAEAAYGVFQFVTASGPSTFTLQGTLRAFGHFDQPNPFAGYLATMLPLAVLMALCGANPLRFRLLAAGLGSLIALGVGLSQSRGAWLGLAVATLFLLLTWSQRTRRWLLPLSTAAIALIVLAVSGALPASIVDRLSQAVAYFGVFDVRTVEVTSDNWAVVERMAHWQAGWSMFLDRPWSGVGAGNYGSAYADYFVSTWREALGHAHNYYINMLAELGVVGGGFLVGLLGVIVADFVRPILGSQSGTESLWRAIVAAVCGGMVVFCVHDMFDNLFVHSVNIQIGVLLGLGLTAIDHLAGRHVGLVAA